jgi:hypothetical protein
MCGTQKFGCYLFYKGIKFTLTSSYHYEKQKQNQHQSNISLVKVYDYVTIVNFTGQSFEAAGPVPGQ